MDTDQITPLTNPADTLTQVYSEIWEGASASEGAFASFMTSNDMIFVVLGVSLIIWFTLLSYLFYTERKLSTLEKEIQNL
jgi:CcmD family protein